jgi:hypothetical protein
LINIHLRSSQNDTQSPSSWSRQKHPCIFNVSKGLAAFSPFITQRPATKIRLKPAGVQAIFLYYDKVKRQTDATIDNTGDLSSLAGGAAQRAV